MDTGQHCFDVFISYSTKDSLAAAAMKQFLQSRGIRCWKAPDDIMPGESWPAAIMRALAQCRIMVLVWSSHSMDSPEVSKELTLAMRSSLAVIPFRIENVAPTGEWEYHLANTHWMDAYGGCVEDHFGKLGDFLTRTLQPRVEATKSAEPPIGPARAEAKRSEEPPPLRADIEGLVAQAVEKGEKQVSTLVKHAVDVGLKAADFVSAMKVPSPPQWQQAAGQSGVVPLSGSPPPLPAKMRPHIAQLLLLGFVWFIAFFLGAGMTTLFLPDFLVGILVLLSPFAAIWLTVRGKLPGTR